jgi:hypothetical protein
LTELQLPHARITWAGPAGAQVISRMFHVELNNPPSHHPTTTPERAGTPTTASHGKILRLRPLWPCANHPEHNSGTEPATIVLNLSTELNVPQLPQATCAPFPSIDLLVSRMFFAWRVPLPNRFP